MMSLVGLSEVEQLRDANLRMAAGIEEMAAEIKRLQRENARLAALLHAALLGLYNGFEPDNQSALYKRIKAALAGKVQP